MAPTKDADFASLLALSWSSSVPGPVKSSQVNASQQGTSKSEARKRPSIHTRLFTQPFFAMVLSTLNSTVLCSTIAFALVIAPKLRGIWLRMCIPKTVDLTGVTAAVSTERSGSNTFVTLDWSRIMGTLPFKIPFCSATLCDDGTIYVSGTIGLRPVSAEGESQAPSIVKGGPMAEARRTMEIIEATLKACGATLENITMVHVYLVDNTKERFAESQRA